MTKITEKELRKEILKQVAGKMAVAARTAPKARGFDNLEILVLSGNELNLLSRKMKEIGEKENVEFFVRDAANVMNAADYVVLLGTRIRSIGLKYCGLCGFENCEQKNKHPEIPCTFNTSDLGIAVGSAASIAMDNRVDNRIMYTIGMAALKLQLMNKEVKVIYGIPLSASAKNPFFDRK